MVQECKFLLKTEGCAYCLSLDQTFDDWNIFQLDGNKQKQKEIEENVVVRPAFSPSKEGFTAVHLEKEKTPQRLCSLVWVQ